MYKSPKSGQNVYCKQAPFSHAWSHISNTIEKACYADQISNMSSTTKIFLFTAHDAHPIISAAFYEMQTYSLAGLSQNCQ